MRSELRRVEFLFDPAAIARRIAALPETSRALGDPSVEGTPSAAFPGARKSAREFYRILSNVHYPHLEGLLETVERCLAGGFSQPTILRTRSRKPFGEALAELHAADHLLAHGFAIEGQDTTKEESPVPDILARGHGIDVAIEVYCPRVWEGLTYLTDDLRDTVKNLDVPLDYRFEAGAEQIVHFANGELLHLHPEELSELLNSEVRADIIARLTDALVDGLADGSPAMAREDRRDLNLAVWVALTDVTKSEQQLPLREGVISGPGISSFSPEGTFERLVDLNIRKKARKKQAVGHASLSLLLVDLSRSELTSELGHGYYGKAFASIITDRLGAGLEGYDMVAFCTIACGPRPLQLHYLIREEAIGIEAARLIFPGQLP